jgi:hypothetical protein
MVLAGVDLAAAGGSAGVVVRPHGRDARLVRRSGIRVFRRQLHVPAADRELALADGSGVPLISIWITYYKLRFRDAARAS